MGIGINMKIFILLLMVLISKNVYSGDCTSISRTNNSANTVLTSTKYNADHNTAYTAINSADGGCIQDGTLEDGALNSTDFAVILNTPILGCEVTRSDAATISVAPCKAAVNGTYVNTATSTNVSWGCTSCASEATGTEYYIYLKTGATGTEIGDDLLISTTAPNDNGYDSSDNRMLGKFFNNSDGDVATTTVQYHVNKEFGDSVIGVAFLKEVQVSGTTGGTSVAGIQTRTLNTQEGDNGWVYLDSNQFSLLKGKYLVSVWAPAWDINNSKVFLVKDPDGSATNELVGFSSYASNAQNDLDHAYAEGIVEISSTTTFEIQHHTALVEATSGLGVANSISGVEEVFTTVRLIKLE